MCNRPENKYVSVMYAALVLDGEKIEVGNWVKVYETTPDTLCGNAMYRERNGITTLMVSKLQIYMSNVRRFDMIVLLANQTTRGGNAAADSKFYFFFQSF